jgi:two-component system, chemotaxis family, chemotaxis protein CheY
MKILIVDDSRAMRLIIARALRAMDLPETEYLEASDGNAALQVIQDLRPELVISDFNMPGISGLDLLRALKSTGIATRFGFVTSEASLRLREEAAEAGARFVITKPFTAANLSQALGPVLAELGCGVAEADDESQAGYTGAHASFPKAAQVAAILKELFHRAVTTSPTPAMALPGRNGHFIAEYMRVDDGSVIGCGVCDIAGAARLGAALTLIPPAVATEAIAAGRVEDTMADNLREIFNVMSRLFDSGGNLRVCLGRIHRPGEPLPAELAGRISKPGARLDNCVEIAGYGRGNLSLLAFG